MKTTAQSIPGFQGASRQSWKDNNPRPLLRTVMDTARDPHDREAVREAFKELRTEEMREVMEDYWFDLNYYRLVADYPRPGESKKDVQKRKADEAKGFEDKIEAAVEAKAKRLLLDLEMPNGKRLRDCTCEECRRMGGWLMALAKKGLPKQRIGDVVSEADVRKAASGIL